MRFIRKNGRIIPIREKGEKAKRIIPNDKTSGNDRFYPGFRRGALAGTLAGAAVGAYAIGHVPKNLFGQRAIVQNVGKFANILSSATVSGVISGARGAVTGAAAGFGTKLGSAVALGLLSAGGSAYYTFSRGRSSDKFRKKR